jgi:hypothetical protein
VRFAPVGEIQTDPPSDIVELLDARYQENSDGISERSFRGLSDLDRDSCGRDSSGWGLETRQAVVGGNFTLTCYLGLTLLGGLRLIISPGPDLAAPTTTV